MRRTIAGLAAATAWLVTAALPALAEPPNTTTKSGEIRGRVTYCGPGGAAGAVAHLPGKSFEARLGPSGDFHLYWVPVGRHSVAIDAPGRATHVIEDVVVVDRRITEMAQIAICRDADGDSSNEDLDCNDNNPNIRPGAVESCDGFDNDCDGTVDEGCATCTDADNDGFFAQSDCGGDIDCDDSLATVRPGGTESCDGFDNDCDGMSDEGFDLQSDPSNCGACGNVCAIRGPGLPAECSAGACLPPEPEICDSVDNDLDGEVDEGFDLQSDPFNCGACGNVCGAPGVCSGGACVTPVETCDHVDNDFDGEVDEGFNVGAPCFCPNPFFIRHLDCTADGQSTYCTPCP